MPKLWNVNYGNLAKKNFIKISVKSKSVRKSVISSKSKQNHCEFYVIICGLKRLRNYAVFIQPSMLQILKGVKTYGFKSGGISYAADRV